MLPALSAARHGELGGRPGAAAHPLGLHHLGHLGQPRLRPRVPMLVLHEAVVDVTLSTLRYKSDVNFVTYFAQLRRANRDFVSDIA